MKAVIWAAVGAISAGAGAAELEVVEVKGRKINLVGDAVSSAQGVVGQEAIAIRPILRSGEVLELVPGMVATQHSGTGKANQYFLRGFNLDHGTDFATFIDGMPVNMRSHGHGQGYTDLNFLIPEAVEQLAYKKGAYYADVGDFSGAGSAHIQTLSKLEHNRLQLTFGEDDYQRALLMHNSGPALLALEYNTYAGPWQDIEEELDKLNGLFKYSTELGGGQLKVGLMGYDNSWNSADQIPARAVEQGLISELGSIDKTVGGKSSRYSANMQWKNQNWQLAAYAIDYEMQLWSNFTYFLDNPVQGDQFEQLDRRQIYGGELVYHNHPNSQFEQQFGLQLRYDNIDEVGLFQSRARQRLGAVRYDSVDELSAALFWQGTFKLADKWRAIVGGRYDYFDFEVKDRAGSNVNGVNLAANNGSGDDGIGSLKGSIIYQLNSEWELYASAGQGYHSNDARGVTIKQDPADGSQVDGVDPLVRSTGFELGARAYISDRLNASASIWSLQLDSELLFVGDAGNTEASLGSKRKGFELTGYYYFNDEWSLDLEYAYTDAEFDEYSADGDHIPGAIKEVIQAGLNAQLGNGWSGSLRWRYFGPRPLVEDGSVESSSSSVWNLRMAYDGGDWNVMVDMLNLTDRAAHDITYFYASRLAGETQEVEDIHFHLIEPRTLRLSLGYEF
ncbi:MAG: TonB-dependent receptor [Cellvibrionaceae bacterium]|nr:TonB-dependent receptor [Cellvibrionaceae bacterium]